MQLALQELIQERVQWTACFAIQVVIQAQVNPNVLSVLLGRLQLRLVPYPLKYVQAVLLASSVQQDQSFALTAGEDTIPTVL